MDFKVSTHLFEAVANSGSLIFLIFPVLLFLSYVVYFYCLRHVFPAISSGAIIMAVGVFILYCIPHYHHWQLLMIIVSLELLIVWFYLVAEFMNVHLSDHLFKSFKRHGLEMGTWVAGTAILVLLLNVVEETWHGFIVFLGMMAIILWIIYISIFLRWMWRYSRAHFRTPVKGTLLLAAVSTQAIALMLSTLFNKKIPSVVYQEILYLGAIFYVIGLGCLLYYLLFVSKRARLAVWPNVNGIIHGAMSTTGLVALTLHIFSSQVLAFILWYTLMTFLLVEIIEISRLIIRIKIKGFRKAIWVYDTTQWSRCFTWSSLYAFILLYCHYQKPGYAFLLPMAHYGQYVVAGLFSIETIIAVSFAIKAHRHFRRSLLIQ